MFSKYIRVRIKSNYGTTLNGGSAQLIDIIKSSLVTATAADCNLPTWATQTIDRTVGNWCIETSRIFEECLIFEMPGSMATGSKPPTWTVVHDGDGKDWSQMSFWPYSVGGWTYPVVRVSVGGLPVI